MIGPDTVIRTILILLYTYGLKVISRLLGIGQLFSRHGFAFHARGWIIERMYLAAVYADPELEPTAHQRIKEIRATRPEWWPDRPL